MAESEVTYRLPTTSTWNPQCRQGSLRVWVHPYQFVGAGGVGGTNSVTNYIHNEFSLSLGSYARLGSSLFVLGAGRVASTASAATYIQFGSWLVTGCINVGSSLPLRSWAPSGSAALVVIFLTVHSSLLLRGYGGLGSSLRSVGDGRVGGTVSGTESIQVGSSSSLRSWAQLESAMLVSGFMNVGFFSAATTLVTVGFRCIGCRLYGRGFLGVAAAISSFGFVSIHFV